MEKVKEIMDSNDLDLPWNVDRLPKTLCPETYNLLLHTDIEAGTFTGDLLIVVDVKVPHTVILLHSVDLEISTTRVLKTITNDEYGEAFEIESTFQYTPKSYWVINMKQVLNPGKYTIHLVYSGRLSNQTVGLYKSSYTTADGSKSDCILSYFEPTYARYAFPCFDEPNFKAMFTLRIVHPSSDDCLAISNTIQEVDICDFPLEGLTTTKFKQSPKMSTYLVCCIVGNFKHSEHVKTEDGYNVAVYCQPSQVDNTIIARDLAVKTMRYFSRYFNTKYTFPKLDLIAIPDSHISAMENWGLVTFRESYILLEEGEYSCNDLQRATEVICHELAHMWFGNLVTIAWWDELWLKEGFATFISYLGGSNAFPEWYHEWTSILDFLHPVLCSDSHLSSHSLVQKVSHPHEIREMFDSITYRKGASIIRMLHNIGPESFRRGMILYLEKYRYGTADTQNLWDALQEYFESFSVTSVMNTWTKQTGYPVVNITSDYQKIVLTQERFLSQKDVEYNKELSMFGYVWDIPIRYITSQDKTEPRLTWLTRENPSLPVDLPYGTEWIKLNWHQVGFYRVNYTPEQWATFSSVLFLNAETLDPEDRSNLLDDAFSLACAGYIGYDIPLRLASYLQTGKEKHFLPWAVSSRYLRELHNKLSYTNANNLFKKYIEIILESSLTPNVWLFDDSVPYLTKKYNGELLKMACWAGHKITLETIHNKFCDWLDGKIGKPNPEIRPLVYKYGLSGKITDEMWNNVWKLFVKEKNPTEKSNLLAGLASVKEPALIEKLLDLAKDTTYIRSDAYFPLLANISLHPTGNRIVWDYLRENWELLVKRFTLNDQKLMNLLPHVTADYSTLDKLEEIKNFFNKYPEVGCGANARKSTLENVNNNIKWHTVHYAVSEDWLQNYISSVS